MPVAGAQVITRTRPARREGQKKRRDFFCIVCLGVLRRHTMLDHVVEKEEAAVVPGKYATLSGRKSRHKQVDVSFVHLRAV